MFGKALFAVLPLLALVAAGPVRRAACPAFALQDYSAFQISDGTAGNAQAQANAVFIDPFAGCDLSTVDATSLMNLQTMREAAEAAETDEFNGQISAASGDAATALSNGKIKNKVLKLTGEVQALNIKAAQGSDEASDIAAETKKLNKNISLDVAAAGQASKGVTGGAAAADPVASASASETESASEAVATKAASCSA